MGQADVQRLGGLEGRCSRYVEGRGVGFEAAIEEYMYKSISINVLVSWFNSMFLYVNIII